MICDIHRRFLEAGADIIETNTFGATSITQSEFFVDDPREHGGRKDPAFYQKIIEDPFLNDLAWEINEQSARQCREWADRVANADGKPRFVAGAIGPLTVSLSNSPDADDAGFRVVTFDQVKAAYVAAGARAHRGRLGPAAGRDDLRLAQRQGGAGRRSGRSSTQDGKELPIMISAAVGRGGETMISAQTIEAFWNAVEAREAALRRAQLLARPRPDVPVSRGARGEVDARRSPATRTPACRTRCRRPASISSRPTWRATWASSPSAGSLNIAGGCCGNTPEHIAAIAKRARAGSRRARVPGTSAPEAVAAASPRTTDVAPRPLRLSGSQPFTQQLGVYMMIGERTNVAGSPKFAKLIKEGKYEEAVSVARQQVENGANVIDICMDEGMIDGVAAMTRFLLAARQRARGRQGAVHGRLLEVGGHRGRASSACRARASSTRSRSRRARRSSGRTRARCCKYGAAVVVMAFDEQGQAATYDDKIRICERAYRILVDEVGFPPEDIIFDPNILTVATGMEEHNNYAVDFIEATRWIKANLPHAKVSGGVSNISFSFRGNNHVREAMHSAFLYHAIRRRHGHGHRQRRHARGVRGDRARAAASWSRTCCSTAAPTRPSGWSTSARS